MLKERKNLLIILAILVLSVTLFILVLTRLRYQPLQGNLESTPPIKEKEAEENDNDISNFFKKVSSDEKEDSGTIRPTPSQDKKANCVLGGLTLQEGTVSSDTVCINP